jgi:hypothetical protein
MKLLIMQFSPTSCHFIPLWFQETLPEQNLRIPLGGLQPYSHYVYKLIAVNAAFMRSQQARFRDFVESIASEHLSEIYKLFEAVTFSFTQICQLSKKLFTHLQKSR